MVFPLNSPLASCKKKGPSLSGAFDARGAPTPALLGFAKSCHVDISEIKIHESSKGSWVYYEYEEGGKSLSDILPSLIEKALNHIPAPKRMRWGEGEIEFLRPIHWVVVLHGATTLPISVFGILANNQSRGHRFHANKDVLISHANEYLEILRGSKVIVDQKEREQIIEKSIHQLAEKNQGQIIIDKDLLNQVIHLVEWPVALTAHFNPAFLEVPKEALISSMQTHQKCFPIQHNDKLLPLFILISNTEPKSLNLIIQGNERVMHARLSDAKFFYDQDRKTPLSTRLEGLKNMIFQKKLGTLYDKSYRIAKLSSQIAKQIGATSSLCERAGKLCKADLLTEMVFEFPELQGIMGSYYALNDGEKPEVAQAIRESYLPRFAKDVLPESQTGISVALADRLDSLIGIFSIGQAPSGDRDPFGLRRQALAVLRILIEKSLPLDLKELCQVAHRGYGVLIDEEVIQQVVNFAFDRFKSWYHEQGIHLQTIEAVMANNPTQPYDCSRRVLAVEHFHTLPEAHHLAGANKRVRNILQKTNISFTKELPEIDPSLLKENAEKNLFDAIELQKKKTQPLILQGKYQEALIALATLQQVVDTFFDEVMVMTEDEKLKRNRIYLLMHLSGLFMQIADISKLAL